MIGEKDDATAQGVSSVDNMQKTVRKEAEKIYPPIIFHLSGYEKDGKPCVRVEVEYSGDTPHFGDAAWIRRGSETIKASDEVFQTLVDLRLHPVREIGKWMGKKITLVGEINELIAYRRHLRWPNEIEVTVVSVNSFCMTFEKADDKRQYSEPIGKLILSFDNAKNCLKILVRA